MYLTVVMYFTFFSILKCNSKLKPYTIGRRQVIAKPNWQRDSNKIIT